MSIYKEKAKELGLLILSSDQAKTMADATAIYQASPEAQAKMAEYQKYQADVQKSMKEGTITQEEFQVMTKQLTEMATELKQDPIVGSLVFAENEFNGFVNNIMTVVKNTIMGVDEEACGCGGSCGDGCGSGGCGGGCH
ncbi:MAG: YlbF family regulator [Lachnospirales bacterium]